VHQAAIVTHQEALNAMEAAEQKINALTDPPKSEKLKKATSVGMGDEKLKYQKYLEKELARKQCSENDDKCKKKAKNGKSCGTGCKCWNKKCIPGPEYEKEISEQRRAAQGMHH